MIKLLANVAMKEFDAESVNAAWKEPGKETILSLTIFNVVADFEAKSYTIELI